MHRDPLSRLISMVHPYGRGMVLAAFLGTLTIATSVSLLATSAWLISKASLRPSIADLGVAVVGVRFFGLARAVFRYLERVVSHDVTFRMLATLRVGFYRALEPLAPARLQSRHSGDLLSQAIHDIDSLQDLYLRTIAPPAVALLGAVLFTLFLRAFDITLALAGLLGMIMAGAALPFWVWWTTARHGAARVQARADFNTALVESLQALPDLIAYGQQKAQMEKFETLRASVNAAQQRHDQYDALQAGIAVVLTHGAAATMLLLAIPRIDGVLLATVALATTAVFEAFAPLAQASLHLTIMRSAGVRLFEIADAPPAVNDPPEAAPVADKTTLAITDLRFRYTPETPTILDGLSLTVAPGERVAILGASGSGKSTLVNVLIRFWEYESGSVQIGGRELRSYQQADIRAMIGVLSQRSYLFNTSVRQNLLLASPAAEQAQLEAAARRAQIHEFILSLPQGYETLIGENGVQLSGGERQRLALARTLLRAAPILILDEATANLDAITERALMETVLESTVGQSLLVFTHRRVLLKRMDRVYLIQHKRLVPYR